MEDSRKAIYFIVQPPRIYFGSQYNSLPGPIFWGQLTRGFLFFLFYGKVFLPTLLSPPCVERLIPFISLSSCDYRCNEVLLFFLIVDQGTDSDLGDVFQESIHHCIDEFFVRYVGIYFYDL